LKHKSLKRQLLNLIKIVVGFLLLFLAFRYIRWDVLWDALHSVSVFWLGMAVLSVLFSLFLKILRWDIFLRNYQVRTPFFRLVSAFFLGQAANILLFIRGGELVRIAAAHTKDQDDLAPITATIAFEKYLDLLFLVLLMIISINSLPAIALQKFGNLQFILLLLTGLLFLAVLLVPFVWQRFIKRKTWSGMFATFQQKIDQFVQASLWLRDPKKLAPSILISLLIWIVMAVTNLLVFKSLSIQLSWDAAILVVILIYIGVLPALMPGNVGPFTYFAQLALVPFAVQDELAAAFAIILYFLVNLPPIILAGVMLLIPQNRKALGEVR